MSTSSQGQTATPKHIIQCTQTHTHTHPSISVAQFQPDNKSPLFLLDYGWAMTETWGQVVDVKMIPQTKIANFVWKGCFSKLARVYGLISSNIIPNRLKDIKTWMKTFSSFVSCRESFSLFVDSFSCFHPPFWFCSSNLTWISLLNGLFLIKKTFTFVLFLLS